MSVSLAILILYIIALFGISWFAKKRSEGNAENYALAGRRLSAPLIAVTIIGLAVGGASTIGVSEHAFRVGLSAGWYTIAWAIGAIVMGYFYGRRNTASKTSLLFLTYRTTSWHEMPLFWACSAKSLSNW